MSDLNKIKEKRTFILFGEIGAFFHLLGRFSSKFYNNPASYKKICGDTSFWGNSGLHDLISDSKSLWEKYLNDENLNEIEELRKNTVKCICCFIKYHTRNDAKGLLKILADAHGIVSGIEKYHSASNPMSKPNLSNAFGYEENINYKLIDERRDEFLGSLKKNMGKIIKNNNSSNPIITPITLETYREIKEIFKTYYSLAIAETRRPNNDLSLYSYAYSIATLTKSNYSKIIIDGWEDPLQKKSKWKILRINFDVISLISKGTKVGHIEGYKNSVNQFFDEIKDLIEFRYPLGNELYRDTTGIYFSYPNFNQINNSDPLLDELKAEINKIVRQNNLEIDVHIALSEPSRTMTVLGSSISSAVKDISFTHITTESLSQNEEENNKEICWNCLFRYKENSGLYCQVCNKRYEGRVKECMKLSDMTIWLDEIADINNNIALLIFSFDLENWLYGKYFKTFRSNSFEMWQRKWQESCKKEQNECKIGSLEDLIKKFETMLNNEKLTECEKKICKSFIKVKSLNNFQQEFFDPVVEREGDSTLVKQLHNNHERATYLVYLLFRKYASLSRILGVWTTTQCFFDEIAKDIKNSVSKFADTNDKRFLRLEIEIKDPLSNTNYSLTLPATIENKTLNLLQVQDNKFVTTLNLEFLSSWGRNIEELKEFLKNKNIDFKLDKLNRHSSEIKGIEQYNSYLPYLNPISYPNHMITLIPAEHAIEIANNINKLYLEKFSKVRDRLPLHIGIIGFEKSTPLNLVMDAGRRLVDSFHSKSKTEKMIVKKIHQNNKYKTLILEDLKGKKQKWKVFTHINGEEEIEDIWYANIRMAEGEETRSESFVYDFKKENNKLKKKFAIPASKIKEGDVILFDKSYLNISYLSNPSDRFYVGEGSRLLEDISQIKTIWESIEEKLKSEKWTINKIYHFWEQINKCQNTYDDEEIKDELIKIHLRNILEISPSSDLFTTLFHAVKSGLLDTCLHWNLKVRKFKPSEENNNEQ